MVPRWCPRCRWQKNVVWKDAVKDHPAPVPPTHEEPLEPPGPRVCRAAGCEIPLDDAWTNEWCPNHWRMIPTGLRGKLLDNPVDSQDYNKAVMGVIRAIKGGAKL